MLVKGSKTKNEVYKSSYSIGALNKKLNEKTLNDKLSTKIEIVNTPQNILYRNNTLTIYLKIFYEKKLDNEKMKFYIGGENAR